MSQDRIFLQSEGDQWFLRNRGALSQDARMDPVLSLLELYGLKPNSVLEVGAANGWRLAAIHQRYGAKCVGIEPSEKAIEDGTKRFPEITLKRGLAHEIPLQDAFHLVIVNYVFHWISRQTLFQSVAEFDRMIADGGYLVIGDFAPTYPMKRRYHHLPNEDVWTYKADYAAIFSAAGTYELISRMTYNHDTHALSPDVPGDTRGAVNLLRKSLSDFYRTA
jgi:ubiquinone/menaquinone biosynthesis C-methylase UbiE